MKTLVRISAITAGLFLASSTFAQDKAASAPPSSKAAHVAPAAQGYMPLPIARMKEELKLSDEQVGKLKELDARAQKDKGAMDAKLGPDEQKARVREIMSRRDKDVNTVLTPEQSKQWSATAREAMRKEHAASGDKQMAPAAAPTAKPATEKTGEKK